MHDSLGNHDQCCKLVKAVKLMCVATVSMIVQGNVHGQFYMQITYTVVWEKFNSENFHVKKFRVEIFLSS